MTTETAPITTFMFEVEFHGNGAIIRDAGKTHVVTTRGAFARYFHRLWQQHISQEALDE